MLQSYGHNMTTIIKHTINKIHLHSVQIRTFVFEFVKNVLYIASIMFYKLMFFQ